MTGVPILEAHHVVKELGEGDGKIVALRDVSLSLYPGEFTLLMGPSGSGKTTLLSILGCILTPTSGLVKLTGECVNVSAPEELANLRRKHLGFIFQSYNLFPTLNAFDNVQIGLDVRGISGAERRRRALRALHDVGLGHRLRSYPGTLSGGEKQRVAVARAIASSPSIILADEPTAALDAENGQAIMELLAHIAKKDQCAILAVTHDSRTIPYADRVIEIEDGKILEQKDSAQSLRIAADKTSGSENAPNSAQRKQQVHA
jgi:putative ABC transport system ATP-binding protein